MTPLSALALAASIAVILFAAARKGMRFSLLKGGRLSRHAYYSAITAAGFLCSCSLESPLRLFLSVVLINVLFSASLLLNNLFDAGIDRVNLKSNPFNPKAKRNAALPLFIHLFLFSLFLSLAISAQAMLAALLAHAVSAAYSCPPLRLKRFFPINTMLIAFAGVIAAALGFLSCPESGFGSLPLKELGYAFILLSLAFNVKDVNDYAGDRKHGIATIVTLLGERRGRLAAGILAALAYLLSGFISQNVYVLGFSALAASLTMLLIVSKRPKINEAAIFLIMYSYILAWFLARHPLNLL